MKTLGPISVNLLKHKPRLNRILVEYFVIFLFFTILFFSGYSLLCKQYGSNDFDSQNFIAWDFSAHKGAVLYKDLLFYYGPLFFYKSVIPWVTIPYGLLTPLILTGFYVIFKKIFNNRLFAFVSIISLTIYIAQFIGIISWNRNGAGALAVTTIAYIISLKRSSKHITHVLLGIITGIVFSLIHDQGVYIIFTYAFLLITRLPIIKGLNMLLSIKYYRWILSHALYFLLGFILGFLPFALYLIQHHALTDFIHSFTEISHAGLFAKMTYLPYAFSKDNLFIYASIFISVFVGMIIFLFNKVKQYATVFYVQLALTIHILILQQKNILRSMGGELGIYCLILLMVIFAYLKVNLERYKYGKFSIFYFYLLLITSFFILLQPFSPKQIIYRFGDRFKSGFTQELKVFSQRQSIQQCLQSSFEIDQLPITPEYKLVYEFIQKEQDFNGKIFTLPSDPIFYVMFDQIITQYITIYEASHISAQEKNIEYIEINNIQYVIYNTIGTDVDEVPSVLRGNTLFKYIFNNYDYHKTIGSFVVLKKIQNPDIFSHIENEDLLPTINTLLINNLRNIPYAEGQYKYNSFSNNPYVLEIFSGSLSELQTFLESNVIESDSIVLAVVDSQSQQSPQENASLTITADNGLTTNIVFRSCGTSYPCLIRLQNIPLFFHDRRIIQIEAPNQPQIHFKLFKMGEQSELW